MQETLKQQQAAFFATMASRFGGLLSPSQGVADIPSSSAPLAAPSPVVPPRSAIDEIAVEIVTSALASSVRSSSPVHTTPVVSPKLVALSPSSPSSPALDEPNAAIDLMEISPLRANLVVSTPVQSPVDAGPVVVPPSVQATPEYSSGGSLLED